MNSQPFGGRRIVHGTPITPGRLLDTMRGSSFCVSFAAPQQLDQCIELVGDDEVLILDNGAFSHWRAGNGAIDRFEFWEWANEAQRRCPAAIAVIPDVIQGDERENLIEMSWALREELSEFPERTMSIWHLDDSRDFLATQCKLCNFIGIGSTNEVDVQKHKDEYLRRIRMVYETVRAIEAVHQRRPWVHLMRGLGIMDRCAWVDSGDSTNVARNHCREKAKVGAGDERALIVANRIERKIQIAADKIPLRGASI